MYKTISIHNDSYQNLQVIASQMEKPKNQVVAELIKMYSKSMKKKEKAKLEKFNLEMKAKIKALKFSKPIKVNTNNIDEDFAALAKTDYAV